MNYALINIATSRVANLIVAEPEDPVPEGYIMVADYPTFVAVGTEWNGSEFVPPPKVEPYGPPKIEGLDLL